MQKFTDDALTDCPSCDGGALRKVFNAVGVVFKGSGFYATDSRKSKTASLGSSAEKSSDSTTSSSGEASTSTKTSSAQKAAS